MPVMVQWVLVWDEALAAKLEAERSGKRLVTDRLIDGVTGADDAIADAAFVARASAERSDDA